MDHDTVTMSQRRMTIIWIICTSWIISGERRREGVLRSKIIRQWYTKAWKVIAVFLLLPFFSVNKRFMCVKSVLFTPKWIWRPGPMAEFSQHSSELLLTGSGKGLGRIENDQEKSGGNKEGMVGEWVHSKILRALLWMTCTKNRVKLV